LFLVRDSLGEIGERCVQFAFGPTRRDGQAVHMAARRQRHRVAGSPEDQKLIAVAADAAQRIECHAIAVVWRSRDEHDVGSLAADRLKRGQTVRAGPGTVGFIHDNRIPTAGGDRGKDFRTFDIVERCDRGLDRRPRIETDGQDAGALPDTGGVHHGRVEVEAAF
jgi:hypothetical protein